ncbi:MAG: MoaD/ThiS family protein [Planctomycetota bacterium]
MNIRVKYWGQIKQAAGVADDDVDVDAPCTIRSVLDAVVAKRGDDVAKHLLDDSGSIRPSLLVVVDEEQIPPNSEKELEEGTTITLLPPIAGGSW